MGGPGPAATRARWACLCGGAPARGASPKQSFRPPFSKGGRIPKGGALWPPSADGGTLHTSGVFGGLGAFTRERPPRPLFFAPIRRQTASPPGRWRAAPEGALARRFPAATGGLVTEKILSFGIFRHPGGLAPPGGGVPPSGIFRHPAGGVVGSRPDRRVTFLCKQESNQRSCQGASAGPLDPRRCRSRLAAAPGLQSRA